MKKLILINMVMVVLLGLIPKTKIIKEETVLIVEDTPQIITSRSSEEERKPIKNYSLTLEMDLRNKSNLEASEYNTMLAGTNLEGIGAALEKAEKQFSVNGLYLLGLCCLESGYGTSGYAVNRNNLVRLERS